MSVFLDTVGLIAIWNADDQWHSAATAAFAEVIAARQPLFTTTFVLLECANAASRRPFRNDVVAIRTDLLAANCLVDPTQDEIQRAWLEYRNGNISSPGIVDLTSFAIMRRLGISDALSNDRHFKQAGFRTLF